MKRCWRVMGMMLMVGMLGVFAPLRAQDKPADANLAEAKSTDTKPANTKPADTKSADAKPVDAKPILKPTAAQFWEIGDKYLAAKDYSSALSKYLMAWLEMPENPSIINRIGEVYSYSNRYVDSTRFYVLAIKLNPGYEDPVVNLGEAYRKAKREDQALGLLEDPTRRQTFANSYRFHHELGLNYLEVGKYDKAIAELESAAQIDPTIGYLFGDLGNAYYLAGKYQDAEKNYEKAIAKSPEDAVALLNSSDALEKLDKLPEAVSALEKYLALRKVPDDDPQRKRLEKLRAKITPPAPSQTPTNATPSAQTAPAATVTPAASTSAATPATAVPVATPTTPETTAPAPPVTTLTATPLPAGK